MRTRQHYDEELQALHHQLSDMGSLALTAVERALAALADQVDQVERDLHGHAVTLIATQQPVARDLRIILAAIAVASELERIADYAKGIAKLVIGPAGAAPLEAPPELLHLGASAQAMLGHTLGALADLNEGAARALFAEEEQIDRVYKPLKVKLAASLAGSAVGPARAADLLFIAHNLERIADRSTNIAERIVYYTSGEQVALNP
jgi:phosphate transport system protein